jgi:hypothetical protein
MKLNDGTITPIPWLQSTGNPRTRTTGSMGTARHIAS